MLAAVGTSFDQFLTTANETLGTRFPCVAGAANAPEAVRKWFFDLANTKLNLPPV